MQLSTGTDNLDLRRLCRTKMPTKAQYPSNATRTTYATYVECKKIRNKRNKCNKCNKCKQNKPTQQTQLRQRPKAKNRGGRCYVSCVTSLASVASPTQCVTFVQYCVRYDGWKPRFRMS